MLWNKQQEKQHKNYQNIQPSDERGKRKKASGTKHLKNCTLVIRLRELNKMCLIYVKLLLNWCY